MADNGIPPVVIGVDGSEAGAAALEWAAREATMRGCVLEVVTVAGPMDGLAGRAADQVRATIARYPSIHLRHRWVAGSPAGALVRAARGAAMLAVRGRGAGRLARVLFGSVDSYCAAHAECPVVIVPARHVVPDPRRPHLEFNEEIRS